MIVVHGHRGSRSTHPENTLPGFEEALQAGAQFIELDVQLSQDDVPIVFHDAELSNRLCRDPQGKAIAVPIPLRSLPAAEISRYLCGDVPQSRFPHQKRIARLTIPTLAEVFEWKLKRAPRLSVNIEIKMDAADVDPDRSAEVVLALIDGYQLHSQIQLQSFDLRVIEAVRKHNPLLTTSCLYENEKDFWSETLRVGSPITGPDFRLLTRENIAHCHQMGLRVVPWTVNEPADWERLMEWGIDGLITDFPRKLVERLQV